MWIFTKEEQESGIPELLAKYGHNYETSRGTEYHDGYDMVFRFGIDAEGWSTERVVVRYYYN